MGNIRDLFKRNLARLREPKFTQRELAPEIEMDPRGYQKYESGEVWPPPERIDLIAKKLEIEPWELFADPDSEQNPAKVISSLKTKATEQAIALGELALEIRRLRLEVENLRNQMPSPIQQALLIEINNRKFSVERALRFVRGEIRSLDESKKPGGSFT